jgi:hypothetical protein
MQILAELIKEGKVNVQTLGQTGKWFKDNYKVVLNRVNWKRVMRGFFW